MNKTKFSFFFHFSFLFLKFHNFTPTAFLANYRNFRSFTRTADYPHRPIIAYGEKESQQITRTGG